MTLAESFAKNPHRGATLLALTAVLVVILIAASAVYKGKWEACMEKNGYTAGIGNREIPGMNPLWWFGGVNAGNYGSMDSPITPQQASVFLPQLRRSNQIAAAKRRARIAEAKTILRASGTKSKFTPDPDFDWASAVCGEAWDPAAIAESQALATMGSINQEVRGERRLEKVIQGNVEDTHEQVKAMGVDTP